MNQTSETRTCTDCGCRYTHTPLMMGDVDMIAHCSTCEPCSEKAAAEEAKHEKQEKARIRWEQTVESEYRKTSTDHPDFPKAIYGKCLAWMRDPDRMPFLGLIGKSGHGKTRVISQIVKHMIWRGDYVTWINSAKFQWCCQNQFNDQSKDEAQRTLRMATKTAILVFDDIGSLKATEAVSDALYGLLEHRTANGLTTLWTSNETLDEILIGKHITEKARSRSTSRLGGYSDIIEL